LAILLRLAETFEEKLNHAVHFDGVVYIPQIGETSFTSRVPLFVISSLKMGDFKMFKTVGKP
jgi:hypothetical protein